uniref:DUF1618 domain-containing protein n=1 Tax=Leersia perrieri TaxID=77586 RepID=A0A0D9XPL2_9ORYZ
MTPRTSVVAAHGDSVLLHLHHYHNGFVMDYFVYNAGSPAADPPRPPSLLLLPINLNNKPKEAQRGTTWQHHHRAEDDDLVVASLTAMVKADDERKEAELLVLRSGEWSVTRAPFIRADADRGRPNQPSSWRTDMVIPIGDRLLGWVDLFCGIILCDMFDKNLQMKYVTLPSEARYEENYDDKQIYLITERNVCVTNGGTTLKFIYVFPRCCCGRSGETYCDNSKGAFVTKIWTLRMDSNDMFDEDQWENIKIKWNILFDTRSKTLSSVCCRDIFSEGSTE